MLSVACPTSSLNRLRRCTAHGEVRAEGVPEHVPEHCVSCQAEEITPNGSVGADAAASSLTRSAKASRIQGERLLGSLLTSPAAPKMPICARGTSAARAPPRMTQPRTSSSASATAYCRPTGSTPASASAGSLTRAAPAAHCAWPRSERDRLAADLAAAEIRAGIVPNRCGAATTSIARAKSALRSRKTKPCFDLPTPVLAR